jgi:hypothetical protein
VDLPAWALGDHGVVLLGALTAVLWLFQEDALILRVGRRQPSGLDDSGPPTKSYRLPQEFAAGLGLAAVAFGAPGDVVVRRKVRRPMWERAFGLPGGEGGAIGVEMGGVARARQAVARALHTSRIFWSLLFSSGGVWCSPVVIWFPWPVRSASRR